MTQNFIDVINPATSIYPNSLLLSSVSGIGIISISDTVILILYNMEIFGSEPLYLTELQYSMNIKKECGTVVAPWAGEKNAFFNGQELNYNCLWLYPTYSY